MNLTIDLDADLIAETILALHERYAALGKELAEGQRPEVAAITRRQMARTYGAMSGLEDALEGARRKGLFN